MHCIKTFVILLICWSFFIAGYADNINVSTSLSSSALSSVTVTPSSSRQVTEYSLSTITAMPDIILTGHTPSATVYLPKFISWDMQAITLHLKIFASPVLDKTSTLTVVINDMPISTLKLNDLTQQPIQWNITLPKAIMAQKDKVLKFIGFLKISEDVCADIENQGNWLRVSGDSTVSFDYLNRLQKPTFAHFPYPLLLKERLSKDNIVFTLPNKPSLSNIQNLLTVTHLLAPYAAWRGFQLSVVNESALDAQHISNNVIMIGTLSQLPFNAIDTSLPFKVSSHQQLMTEKGQAIDSNTGVMMIAPSPWNTGQSLLVMTGDTEEAVNKAVSALNDLLKQSLWTNADYVLVNKRIITETPEKPETTLQALGYADQVVYGDGQHTLHYSLFLDKNVPDTVNMMIHFAYASFLKQREHSFLTLKVNGMPVESIKLSDYDATAATWVVAIPGKLFTAGNNSLDFLFDMRLPQRYCAREYLSSAWASIENTTTVEIHSTKNLFANDIAQVNAVLTGNTVVALPENSTLWSNTQFLSELLNFVKNTAGVKKITVMRTQDVKSDTFVDNNVIYLGDIYQNTTLSQAIDIAKIPNNLPIKLTDSLGYILLTNTPGNTSKLLVVNAYQIQNYTTLLQLLNNSQKNNDMNGNVVLVAADGSFLTLDMGQDKKRQIAENYFYRYQYYVLAFIILFLGLIVIAIWRKMKR